MEEIIKQLLDNNLRDLRGMNVKGKIPIDPAFINELIAGWLDSGSNPETGTSAPSVTEGDASKPDIPLGKMPDLIRQHLKKLELGVEDGKMVVSFEFRVDE